MAGIIILFMAGVWLWQRSPHQCRRLGIPQHCQEHAAPMVLSLFNKAIDFVFAAYYLRVLGPAAAGSFATAIAMAGILRSLPIGGSTSC
ncbi:MAG: hypothetical protein R3C44_07085 [Chloroflexota bacterium]